MFGRNFVVIVVLTGLSLWGTYMLVPAYIEYNKTSEQLRDVEKRLLDSQKESEALRGDISDLKTNPAAIERVAREKFGWVKADEKVYDFTKPPRSNLPTRRE